MMIAIAANINNTNAQVNAHFGRCAWYFLYHTESGLSLFIENSFCDQVEKAGSEAAELLISKNVNMIIAGRFGSKVIDVFRKNNIQMVIPESQKTIAEIINQVK